jgi:isopentenyl-diphosphate delta-isomerase
MMPPAVPEEQVILVDERDREIGTMGKLEAHRRGALHRAFSIFGFDPQGRLLLQRRAAGKYHSGGLWTNTCCSHPRPGEATGAAAARRLREEMGLGFPLTPAFTFRYEASFPNGLREHELDHVFFGDCAGEPRPDPAEVDGWRYAALDELAREVAAHPEQFTAWLAVCLPEVIRRHGGLDIEQGVPGPLSPGA